MENNKIIEIKCLRLGSLIIRSRNREHGLRISVRSDSEEVNISLGIPSGEYELVLQ